MAAMAVNSQFQRVNTTNDQNVFAFVRERDNDNIFAVFNLSPGFNGATLLDTLFYGTYTDVFTNDTITFSQGAFITLPGWSYHIYEGVGTITGIADAFETPLEFVLNQNYPNPFNSTTRISYSIPEAVFVNLAIYDVLGREILTLVSQFQKEEKYIVIFDASKLSSGIYFYTFRTSNGFLETKKMLHLR
jgi:hypothetical protein